MDTEVSKALQIAWGMLECRETGDRKGDRKKKHISIGNKKEREGERGREEGRERERQAEGDNAERN